MKRKLLISFISVGVFAFFAISCIYIKKEQAKASAYLTQIAQTGPRKEALCMEILADWMGISEAKPIPLPAFDLKRAEERLRCNSLIESAKLSIKGLQTLLVDYTLRQPRALVADFENFAIDQHGFIFPLFPFFTPKKMVKFYFGIDSLEEYLEKPIEKKYLLLGFSLLDQLNKKEDFIFQIDLSQMLATSLGKREIIVTIQTKEGSCHYLRLTEERYKEEIRRYYLVCDRWEGDLIFDLRIEGLAFVQKGEDISF